MVPRSALGFSLITASAARSLRRRRVLILLGCLIFGVVLWLIPQPAGLDPRAWHLFSIFAATIVGVVTKPLPMGAVALIGLTATVITGTLTPAQAMSGFSDSIVWLIVSAFFIARGITKTGLGRRIACQFIARLGRRTLGLSYGLIATDLVLAPAIPSNTARSGGIVFPFVVSVSEALGSRPENGTARRIGAYLLLTSYQGAMLTSAMFLTGTTGNLVTMRLAADHGIVVSWGTWFLAAIVPGVISMLLLPLLVLKLFPPEILETPGAATMAADELKRMGPMRFTEWIMLGIFATLLILWAFGARLGGIEPTTAAFIGLSLLLILGELSWTDILNERGAWDTLMWFAALLTMASFLNTLGLVPWLGASVAGVMGGFGWQVAFLALSLVYFYSHYLFASSTAHASAMYGVFLATAIAVGSPSLLAALVLAFLNALLGGLTHYGGGPAPVFFGAGYVSVADWWRVGGLVSVANLLIWGVLGGIWWHLLGIF